MAGQQREAPAARHAVIDPIAGATRAEPGTGGHTTVDPVAGQQRDMPVAAYALPLDSLQAVAEAAGLQWVNSDTDKIRAVQAAMAAEPAPARVARERKPVAAADDGPLVLVETRKDLSQFKLPFDTTGGTQPPV